MVYWPFASVLLVKVAVAWPGPGPAVTLIGWPGNGLPLNEKVMVPPGVVAAPNGLVAVTVAEKEMVPKTVPGLGVTATAVDVGWLMTSE